MYITSPTRAVGLAALISLTSLQAHAAFYQFLTHDSLGGYITQDAFLGNADDFVNPSFNSFGGASQFADQLGNFGFLRGYMFTQGLTIVGPQDQQIFGANEHTVLEMAGEWNSFVLDSFNNPFTQSLNTNSVSLITIAEDQTYTTSFEVFDSAFNSRLRFSGTGRYLLADQDASTMYAGDELTHFQFVTPLLPQGWLGVAHEIQSYEVLDGTFAGAKGVSTLTFFTTNAESVPVLPPVPLGPPWQTSGKVAITTDGAEITLLGEPAPGTPATAALSGGDVATVQNLVLRGNGDTSLTITGAGTEVQRAPDVAGIISVGGAGAASLTVADGGRLESGSLYFQQNSGGTAQLTVDGAGSVLDFACQQGGVCTGAVGLLDIGGFFASATDVQTTVSSGGRIDVTARDNTNAVVLLTGKHTLTVSDSDSRVRIVGTQNGTLAQLQTGVSIEQQATMAIVDGGAVDVVTANAGVSGVGLGFNLPDNPNLAPAELMIDGAGSTLTTPLLAIGQGYVFDPNANQLVEGGPGARSVATVRNGGTVIADTIVVGGNGTLRGDGGILIADVVNRGQIAPGESPGMLVIDGDFAQDASGLLRIEIGGSAPGTYDVLQVTGTATLGGTLKIELVDGYVPEAGARFDFLTAGQLVGDFAFFDLPTIGGEPALTVTRGPNGFSATVVPLPGALWLFGAATLALAARRRRA